MDDTFKPDLECARDQRVADRYFQKIGNRSAKRAKVLEVKVMAGIHTNPKPLRRSRRCYVLL